MGRIGDLRDCIKFYKEIMDEVVDCLERRGIYAEKNKLEYWEEAAYKLACEASRKAIELGTQHDEELWMAALDFDVLTKKLGVKDEEIPEFIKFFTSEFYRKFEACVDGYYEMIDW